jgi:hypothetical protein
MCRGSYRNHTTPTLDTSTFTLFTTHSIITQFTLYPNLNPLNPYSPNTSHDTHLFSLSQHPPKSSTNPLISTFHPTFTLCIGSSLYNPASYQTILKRYNSPNDTHKLPQFQSNILLFIPNNLPPGAYFTPINLLSTYHLPYLKCTQQKSDPQQATQ